MHAGNPTSTQTDHPVPRNEIGLQSKTPFQAQKSVHHILCVIYVTLLCVKWIITESTVNREIFLLKNVHEIIFRVKIFSYASRPYQNILKTKISNNENLEHKVAQRILADNGSRQQIEWNHVFSVTTACWRGVAMRQGSLQRGGSTLKKGVVVDRRTFTRAKNDCWLFLWREVQ